MSSKKKGKAEVAARSMSGDEKVGSEAEMKALMSMFVEIMGMSDDKNDFKWPPSAKAATAMYADAQWDVCDENQDNDDDDDDSIPALCDGEDILNEEEEEEYVKKAPISNAEWARLEQVARDEHLEEQEKARKAAKRREKKQRRKAKAKQEAALKQQEALRSKQEAQIQSWQSRVVASCQEDNVSKLQALLKESPPQLQEKHLHSLLPHCIPNHGDARKVLAEYVVNSNETVAFNLGQNGRNAVHMACLAGNEYFVKMVTERAKHDTDSFINTQCQDSGWTPLHYAVASGSPQIVELLLANACNVKACTNGAKTSRASDEKGITARELAELIVSGKQEQEVKTEGEALQEVLELHVQKDTAERQKYLSELESIRQRIGDVEKNGYGPLKESGQSPMKKEETVQSSSVGEEEASKKRKKKKKSPPQPNKQVGTAENDVRGAAVAVKPKEDPLVVALLGMGFSREQIHAAATACGGMERATADEMVMWILGGGQDPVSIASEHVSVLDVVKEAPFSTDDSPRQPVPDLERVQVENAEAARREKEESRLAARRLAAKRDEQRRRNREWNNRAQARQQEELERRAAEEAQRLVQGRAAQRRSSGDGRALMGFKGDAYSMPFEDEAPKSSAAVTQILQRPPHLLGPIVGASLFSSNRMPVIDNEMPPTGIKINTHADENMYGEINALGSITSNDSVASGISGRQTSALGKIHVRPPPGLFSSGVPTESSSTIMSGGNSFDDFSNQEDIREAFVPTTFKPTPAPLGRTITTMPTTTIPPPGLGPAAASSNFLASSAGRAACIDSRQLSSRLPGMDDSLAASGVPIPLGFERPAPHSPGLGAVSSVKTGFTTAEEPSLSCRIRFGLNSPGTSSSLLGSLVDARSSGTQAGSIWRSTPRGQSPRIPGLTAAEEKSLDSNSSTLSSTVIGSRHYNSNGWLDGELGGGNISKEFGSIW